MKFRKKPVEIEAIKYTGENVKECMSFGGPDGGICWGFNDPEKIGGGQLIIETLEGDMLVSKGDWIIKGVKNEFYPCKPDIFEMSYEEIK